jgi:hypothetical protein
MRFIKKPQFGSSSKKTRQRGPAPLTCRQSTDRNRLQSTIEPESRHRRSCIGEICARRSGPEANVVGDREFVVQTGAVSEKPDTGAYRSSIGTQIDTQHVGLTSSDRHETCEGAEQRGLSCPICSAQKNDATAIDVEINAS